MRSWAGDSGFTWQSPAHISTRNSEEGAVHHQVEDDEEEQQDGVGVAQILVLTDRHFDQR